MLQIVFAQYLSEVEKHISQFLGEDYLNVVIDNKFNSLYQKVHLVDLADLASIGQSSGLFELSEFDSLPELFIIQGKVSLSREELDFLLSISENLNQNRWLYFPSVDLKADLKKELTQKGVNFIEATELSATDKKNLANLYVSKTYPQLKSKIGTFLTKFLQSKKIPQEIFDFIDFLVLAEIDDWDMYVKEITVESINLFQISLSPSNLIKSLPVLLKQAEKLEENQLLITSLYTKLKNQKDKQALRSLILTDYHNKIILKASPATWVKKWLFDLTLNWSK